MAASICPMCRHKRSLTKSIGNTPATIKDKKVFSDIVKYVQGKGLEIKLPTQFDLSFVEKDNKLHKLLRAISIKHN